MRNVANVLPAAGWLTVMGASAVMSSANAEEAPDGLKLPAVRSRGSLETGRRTSGNSLTIQTAVGGRARYGSTNQASGRIYWRSNVHAVCGRNWRNAMKAVVLHEYGGPEKLEFEDNVPDPQVSGDTVLIAAAAASVNPIDWKVRSGARQKDFPLSFPAILGRDVSGVVRAWLIPSRWSRWRGRMGEAHHAR